jgi:hypothetical protein
MDDFEERVRTLIRNSGKSVRRIARDTGLDYFQLWRWYSGRTGVLRANDAETLERHLTGEVGS